MAYAVVNEKIKNVMIIFFKLFIKIKSLSNS